MPFVIDIDPVAFRLLGLEVRWYGIVVAVAAAVAVWVAQREARRRAIAPGVVPDAAISVGLAALVGGRALYLVQNELGTLVLDPAHVAMVWMGGLSFYGAVIGAVLALAVRDPLPRGARALPGRPPDVVLRRGTGVRGQRVAGLDPSSG